MERVAEVERVGWRLGCAFINEGCGVGCGIGCARCGCISASYVESGGAMSDTRSGTNGPESSGSMIIPSSDRIIISMRSITTIVIDSITVSLVRLLPLLRRLGTAAVDMVFIESFT